LKDVEGVVNAGLGHLCLAVCDERSSTMFRDVPVL
jgi:hypothetical protein